MDVQIKIKIKILKSFDDGLQYKKVWDYKGTTSSLKYGIIRELIVPLLKCKPACSPVRLNALFFCIFGNYSALRHSYLTIKPSKNGTKSHQFFDDSVPIYDFKGMLCIPF